MELAQRLSGVRGEGAFEVLVRARKLEAQGQHVVHMEIGEPDFPTPAHIVEAGRQALAEGHTKYGPTPGDPELREAIAEYLAASRGIAASPDQVIVTPGGKPVLFFTMLALLEAGDEAMYPNPGFPIYESVISMTGAKPVAMPLVEERGFSLDLDQFRDLLTDRTKLIVLNSPQNPTGGAIPAEDLRAIADLVRDRDLVVLSDEIYSQIYFGEPPRSIASEPGMTDKTVILDGFSKAYSMTGWRIGFGHFPQWLCHAVALLMVNSNSHTASFTQRAALAALRGPHDAVRAMVAEFAERSRLIVDGFNAIPGFRCAEPGGAFYAFPNIEGTGIPAPELADRILAEAGVACLPGTSFGRHGSGYLRFSYATARDEVRIALDRIGELMGKETS